MKTNENILKLTGSASIPRDLEIGKEYDITASCECVSEKIANNQDGTVNHIFTLKLIGNINIISEKEIIQAEAKRSSMAKALRMWIRDLWIDEGSEGDSEDFYKSEMQKIINDYKNKLN